MLINNAGVLVYTDFDGVTADDLLRCFAVNAVGPLLVAQQVLLVCMAQIKFNLERW